MSPALLAERLREIGLQPKLGQPLAPLSYWRVGGPAAVWAEVPSLEALTAVMALDGEPPVLLGGGSNSLIHDEGIPGLCIKLSGELAGMELDGDQVVAGAGMRNAALIARFDRLQLSGAEAWSGVPGCVGGSVVMNAGTRLGDASDMVESVTLVLPGGEQRVLRASELGLSYRHSELPAGAVVASARLRARPDPEGERRRARRHFLERRKATQPLSLPSCGSTFTNPPGDFAGRLIEAAGLKGARVGAAQISEQHANFFLNTGGASAEDLRALIAHARARVLEEFAVLLEPEVRLLGPWGPDALAPALSPRAQGPS